MSVHRWECKLHLYIDLHLVLYLSHQTYRLPDAFLRYKKSASTVELFLYAKNKEADYERRSRTDFGNSR